MKGKINNFVGNGRRFKKEFRRELRLLIVFTLGFTIAFTWRQTIFDLSQAFVQFITKVESISALSILASIFITLTSIILVYIASYFLKDKADDYNGY